YIDGTARQAGNVLIISFKQPLDVAVNRVAEQAPDYIGAARRDPDGTAVRMALAQNVTVHAMSAGEKFFVDLLPTSWSGMPPGLPQDVVDELARRAREAERLLARQRTAVQEKTPPPIRVHVASQPTFTRYVFAVPGETGVSADRAKDRLVLKFDSPLTFDLGDVQAALPKTVQEISSELDQDSSLVRFIVGANSDTRTFRDESGYVVDVLNPPADTDGAADGAPQNAAGAGAVPSMADAAAKISAAAAAPGAPPSPAPAAAPAPTAQMTPPPAKAAMAPPNVEARPAAPSMTPALSPAPPAVPPSETRPAVHGALPASADAAQNNPPAAAAAAPAKVATAAPETTQPPAPQIAKPTAPEIAKPDTAKPAAAASAPPQATPPQLAAPVAPTKSSAAAPPPATAPADSDSAGGVPARGPAGARLRPQAKDRFERV